MLKFNYRNFFLIFFKWMFFLSLSLTFFYFFETPFLIETAWAEEALSEATTNKVESEIKVLDKEVETLENTKKVEEPSWIKKVGSFLWDYKWYLIGTSVIIISSILIYNSFSVPPVLPEVAPTGVDLEVAKAALQDPKFPDWKVAVEHLKEFTFSPDATRALPEHFMVNKASFSGPSGSQLTGILFQSVNDSTTFLPFRVYPTMPLLLEDPKLSILVNQFEVLNNIPRPYEGVLTENPYGFSNDPSMNAWLDHAKATYPILKDLSAEFALQYQRVALVEPSSMTYSYFHQVSVVPINIETLSTPFETNLEERLLKVYLFKDNETGWIQ